MTINIANLKMLAMNQIIILEIIWTFSPPFCCPTYNKYDWCPETNHCLLLGTSISSALSWYISVSEHVLMSDLFWRSNASHMASSTSEISAYLQFSFELSSRSKALKDLTKPHENRNRKYPSHPHRSGASTSWRNPFCPRRGPLTSVSSHHLRPNKFWEA